jgi:hypothetical protein
VIMRHTVTTSGYLSIPCSKRVASDSALEASTKTGAWTWVANQDPQEWCPPRARRDPAPNPGRQGREPVEMRQENEGYGYTSFATYH